MEVMHPCLPTIRQPRWQALWHHCMLCVNLQLFSFFFVEEWQGRPGRRIRRRILLVPTHLSLPTLCESRGTYTWSGRQDTVFKRWLTAHRKASNGYVCPLMASWSALFIFFCPSSRLGIRVYKQVPRLKTVERRTLNSKFFTQSIMSCSLK